MKKIVEKLSIIVAIIFAISMFSVFNLILTACTFGPNNTVPDLVRPNIPRQSSTLNQSQAHNIIDDWLEFANSNNVPAFSMNSRFETSEIWYSGNSRREERITRHTTVLSDGINFLLTRDAEELFNGDSAGGSFRMYRYNGEIFHQIREDGSLTYSRFVVFSDDELRLVDILGYEANAMLGISNLSAARHGNYARIIYRIYDNGQFVGELEMIFDSQDRLIWLGASVKHESGRDRLSGEFHTRIIWGTTSVPRPNINLFNRPNADNIRIDVSHIWWINWVNLESHIFYDIGDVVRFDGNNSHWSWGAFVIEVPEKYIDYIQVLNGGGNWAGIKFLRVGYLSFIIRSLANSSVYEVITVYVVNYGWWWQ
ncbi:MAG: hypothetical protein FWE03_04195 [Firmicutes bacterium]|nr:hypothetical protein [Bacillota bacterium]